jgi:hypothetical protein
LPRATGDNIDDSVTPEAAFRGSKRGVCGREIWTDSRSCGQRIPAFGIEQHFRSSLVVGVARRPRDFWNRRFNVPLDSILLVPSLPYSCDLHIIIIIIIIIIIRA